jgi:hypothetical protein
LASYITSQAAFAIALMLLPFLTFAQASQTTVERIGCTDTYNLIFHQDPDDPISLAGVEYNVVVSGTSPSISLSVPDDTWLFEVGETILNVGSPEVSGTTYKFPIYAWREDNDPQEGDGLYLRVTASNGIVIAVEDFPTKAALTALSDGETPSSLMLVLQQATSVTIWNLEGTHLGQFVAPDLPHQVIMLWPTLGHGIYILQAAMADKRMVSLKLRR